jgi:hypothetical protein
MCDYIRREKIKDCVVRKKLQKFKCLKMKQDVQIIQCVVYKLYGQCIKRYGSAEERYYADFFILLLRSETMFCPETPNSILLFTLWISSRSFQRVRI